MFRLLLALFLFAHGVPIHASPLGQRHRQSHSPQILTWIINPFELVLTLTMSQNSLTHALTKMALFLEGVVWLVGVQLHNTTYPPHIGDTNDTHRNHIFTHSLHSLTHVGARIVRLSHLPHHYGRKAPKGHTMTPERQEQIEEPHGTRDTFVPPPIKCDDDFITETDEQLTAALIKGKAEADAYDDNLAQEMKAALDSLTEEDITVSTNPPIVHQHDGQWYFWEETYSECIGPFRTEIAANKALDHYCDVVLGQGRDPS